MVSEETDNLSYKPRVVIIGAGNVATHLSRGLARGGCRIETVCSRTQAHAERLAGEFEGCEAVDNVADIPADADFYLISTSDAAVRPIAAAMPRVKGLVAHTSGSVPMEALSTASERYAVLYPLQTFTRTADLRLDDIPFFTEASDAETYTEIDRFAAMLSPKVYHADSDKRKTLHIAGVLSCNFANYLWDCTARVLEADGYGLDVVRPLIEQTLRKAMTIGPEAAQTGPAMRGDRAVIESHISRLDTETARIYREITDAIMRRHNIGQK